MTPISSISKLSKIPSVTVKSYLVERIQEAIISGAFRPGERLNESQLAAQYEVSRIPVREALLQLEEKGLVVNRPRRGMFVILLTEEEVQRINGLRIILEAEALKLCRANLNASTEARLIALLERMESWNSEIDLDACALDLEFHRTIWQNTNNPYLEKTLNTLVPMLFSHQALAYIKEPREKLWPANHHRALVEFIQGFSSLSAETAMIHHLRVKCTNPERFTSLAAARIFPF